MLKCPSDMPQNHSQGKRKLKLSRRHKKNEQNDGCSDPHSLVSDTKPVVNSDSKIVKKRGESPSTAEDRDPSRHLTRRSKVRQKHQPCDKLSNKRQAIEVNKSSVKPTMEDRGDAEKMVENEDADHSTMQNILRHLGSGFEVFASALDGGGSRLKNLITMIKSENVGDQMTGLSELCEYISVSPEEAMITFPTEQVVPILLELLHGSPDIMLLSSRAITLLVDVYPPSAKHVARHGGVRILCEKLLCIEYIDLAEQSIQALGKISQYCPEALLKDSALEAVLSYIDFFQVGLQRVAVATAANICGAFKNTSSKDALPSIQSVVPTVVQLSSSSDNKISLSACQALTSIAAWCNKQDEPVESIIQLDYFQQFVERMKSGGPGMKPCIFYSLVTLLTESAASSNFLSEKLLELDVPSILSRIFASLSTSAEKGIDVSLNPRNAKEMFLLFDLLTTMLPPVLATDLKVLDKTKSKKEMKNMLQVDSSNLLFPKPQKRSDDYRESVMQHSDLDSMSKDLLSRMMHMDFPSFNRDTKIRFLSVIDKLIFYATPDCLEALVLELPIANFMVGLLQSGNDLWPLFCLKITASMLQKNQKLKDSLLKEGVFHEIKRAKESFDASEAADAKATESFVWFANRIISLFFSDEQGHFEDGKTRGTIALEDLMQRFPDDQAVKEFFEMVSNHSVSSYEIRSSNILESLSSFVKGEDLGTGASSNVHRLDRLTRFMHLLEDDDGSPAKSLQMLINMLQEVLTSSEQLPLYDSSMYDVPSFPSMLLNNLGMLRPSQIREENKSSDSFVKGLKALGTPVRIRMNCLDESLGLQVGVVLIEPLATVGQVQEHMKPKIRRLLQSRVKERFGRNKNENVRVTRSRAKILELQKGMGSGKDEISSQSSEDQMVEHLSDSEEDDVDMLDDSNVPVEDEKDLCQEIQQNAAQNEDKSNNKPSTSKADAGDQHFNIKFYMHGDELDPSATLLRVLQSREEPSGNNKALNMKYIWENAHQIDFRISKVSDAVEPASTLIGAQESGLPRQTVGQSLNSILEEEDPNVLHTISILETIERTIRLDSPGQQQVHILGSARMPIKSLLTNSKLSSKLMKQMKDPLLVCSKIMPEWCSVLPIVAKFLFSFDLRKKYFRYHAFGLGRTLLAMLEDAAPPGNSAPVDEDLPLRMPRIPRQKVRISRCHILESARKVFDRYANKNSRLEVEFYNEAGSGLGPTLEFYTLLSTELQRKDLCMWRDIGTGQNSNEQKVTDNSLEKAHYKQPGLKALDLVTAPFGLFPRPMQTEKSDEKKCEKILQNFRLLGQSMAKAIQDDRLMDIPLSRPFYKFIITGALEPADLSYIDPSLAKYLEDILSGCGSSQVLVNGVPIDDLCLSFVLPGDEEYELCPGGKDISVSSETAEQYVNSLYDALLDTGVRAQIESFKSGFSDIFSPDNLRIFYEEEIEDLVCGDSGKGKWTKPSLSSAIKCDHGYSADSPAVTALVNVLSEFDTKDQQLFLKFVTGAPRLPAGGFGSLNPKLTVVKKAPDVPSSLKESPLSPHSKDKMIRDLADKDLPSVMTCANYLKLPPYSSENILRDRLLYAIREGQGSFDLS